jgi:hypothetical protein
MLIYNDGLPKGKGPPAGTRAGIKNLNKLNKYVGQNIHHHN